MHENVKILIVDDDPIGREVLDDLLAPEGYELYFAEDGPAAIQAAHEVMPDLLLLDVMMPGMDGFEVCRRLRQGPVMGEVPIIMVTALDDQKSRIQGLEAGADDFVSKPFNRHELQARVRTITRLNRYRRLLAERVKFERVVEQSETGYLLIDAQDRIRFANPKAGKYLSLDAVGEQAEPVDFLPLAQRHYRCEPYEAWTGWPGPPQPAAPRYLVRPETETVRALWLQVEVLDQIPATPGPMWIVSLTDVSDQISTKNDMRSFHMMVRHKLRTPFVGLSSGLEIITKHAEQLSQEEMVKLVKMAQQSLHRLQGDVEQVLHYVKTPLLAQGGDQFALRDLPPVVEKIGAAVGVPALFVAEPGALGGRQVALSRQALELIFYELLENSCKFHPEESPTIDVSLELGEGEDTVTVWVRDNGRRMSPEELSRAWAPYYQGEKLFTGEVPGMGLGLSAVASLVWSVNGRCQLHNRTDAEGLLVELTLPLAPQTEEATANGDE